MATTIYSEQTSYSSWWFFTKSGRQYGEGRLYRYPYPRVGAVSKKYLNKVWDAVAGDWVLWLTDYPDPAGGHYEGPGEYGVDTSDYRMETVVYGREQL
jgi:hypothetical protein